MKNKKTQVVTITQNSLDYSDKKILITTSNDLLLKARWPRLRTNEQRLVMYMLALVEKWDEDFKIYRISVRELGNIMGSNDKNLYKAFDNATEGLMSKIIKWTDPRFDNKRLHKVTWCSSASLAEGEGFVELSFDPKLKPFLLALKNNFTQYELGAVIRLKSHYSLRLYQLLKYHEGLARLNDRKSAVIDLKWLKNYLSVEPKSYNLFGHFKARILVPAQKDIFEKTDIKFTFKGLKQYGRKIRAIQFFWEKNPKYDQMELPFVKMPEPEKENFNNEKINQKLFETLTYEFGISNYKSTEFLKTKDELYIEEVLEFVRSKITSGEVNNIPSFTVMAIEKDFRAKKPQHEIEKEKKIVQEKQAKKEKKMMERLQHEFDEHYKMKTDEFVKGLSKAKKAAQIKAFEKDEIETSNQFIKKSYRESGIEHPFIRSYFDSYLSEKFLPEQDREFIFWAKTNGHDVVEKKDGEFVFLKSVE